VVIISVVAVLWKAKYVSGMETEQKIYLLRYIKPDYACAGPTILFLYCDYWNCSDNEHPVACRTQFSSCSARLCAEINENKKNDWREKESKK
jgi:hypothetical protein